VDDEPSVAAVTAEALTLAGHRVRVAHDGVEARGLLLQGEVDLVITDLRMPRMGGQELYEEIRQRFPGLASRVIFSTGDTVSRPAREFLEQTGNPRLAKPFSIAELQDLVERVLEVAAGAN
jgi:CheY-like chemotaxis protein